MIEPNYTETHCLNMLAHWDAVCIGRCAASYNYVKEQKDYWTRHLRSAVEYRQSQADLK